MANSRNNRKLIDLSLEDEQLHEAFLDICRIDGKHAASGISTSQRKRQGFLSKKEKLKKRLEKRKEIMIEQERRFALKKEAMRKAELRLTQSADLYSALTREMRDVSNSLDVLEISNSQHENKLATLNALFSQDSEVASRIQMLGFVNSYIDTRYPVKYELVPRNNGLREQFLYWVTKRNPVSWVDDEGYSQRSLTSFGPFIVKVTGWVYPNGTTSCDVSVRMFDDSVESYDNMTSTETAWHELQDYDSWKTEVRGFATSEGYPHPHISNGGGVCTGNSKSDILKHLMNSDYALVIQSVMMVLTHYNPSDPYRYLYYFEPTPNTYSSDTTCGTCGKIHMACQCDISTVSGEVVPEGFMSPCGCTYSECLANHEKHGSSSGINGTGCFPKRTSARYQVVDEGLDKPGLPSQIIEFKQAIEALGSPILRGWVEDLQNEQES